MKILYIPIYVVNYIANYLNFFVIEQSKVVYIDVGHGYVGDKFEIFVHKFCAHHQRCHQHHFSHTTAHDYLNRGWTWDL